MYGSMLIFAIFFQRESFSVQKCVPDAVVSEKRTHTTSGHSRILGLLLNYAHLPPAESQACSSRNNPCYLRWVPVRKKSPFVHKVEQTGKQSVSGATCVLVWKQNQSGYILTEEKMKIFYFFSFQSNHDPSRKILIQRYRVWSFGPDFENHKPINTIFSNSSFHIVHYFKVLN